MIHKFEKTGPPPKGGRHGNGADGENFRSHVR